MTPFFYFLNMSKTILNFSSDLGYWCDDFSDMGSETSYSISVLLGEIGNDKDLILPISKSDYVPTNGDKVFFLPGVHVPRNKFKNLCDESGIRTVRDPAKANVFIANNNTLNKVVTSTWAFKIKTSDFIALTEFSNFQDSLDDHHYQKIVDALEFYTEKCVFVDRPTSRLIMKYVYKYNREPKQEKITSVLEDFKVIVDLANQASVYDESTIIDQLNGDEAAVIDHTVYNQLKIMLESSDNDNTVLAMEIMANCKYSASLVHLIILFYYHGDVFYNSHTKTHVNFKSLLGWLGLTHSNPQIGSDHSISVLKEKGQLTSDKLNTLLSYIGDDVAQKGDTSTFKMKHITLAPELLAEMNVNYSYQMQSEFEETLPEVEEEVLEISDEDISEAFTRIERNELKEELIALEAKEHLTELKNILDSNDSNDEEIIKEVIETPLALDTQSNNNQITQANESDDFDWF
jgi:hypothetical protein